MEMDLKIFGERLRGLRMERRMSARQLAMEIDRTNSIVIMWENAQSMPSAGSVFKLAKFFNVTAGYLMGLED